MFAPSFVRLVGAVQYLSGDSRHTKKNDIADQVRISGTQQVKCHADIRQ